MNKQQIILLALLVSFVSSIATGISVVSIMQQDQDVPVTQTINNVIERTIERASSDSKPSTPSVVTKETIVVKQDDAVMNAIETASKGIVKIYQVDSASFEHFVGLGVIASSTGKVVARVEGQYGVAYAAHLSGGNTVQLSFISHDSLHGVSVFQAQQGIDPNDIRVYSAVTLADVGTLKVGQSVVLIANTENLSVATGIISTFEPVKQTIKTSIRSSDLQDQAILINLSGEVAGLRDLGGFDGGFIPDTIIKTYAAS